MDGAESLLFVDSFLKKEARKCFVVPLWHFDESTDCTRTTAETTPAKAKISRIETGCSKTKCKARSWPPAYLAIGTAQTRALALQRIGDARNAWAISRDDFPPRFLVFRVDSRRTSERLQAKNASSGGWWGDHAATRKISKRAERLRW